jgi:small GTP-binding protein
MAGRILDAKSDELRTEERRQLAALAAALARFDAAPADQQALRESTLQLDELFLLVVAGEFNAGKSAFINALLGSARLEEGVTPTTTRIHLLRYGEAAGCEPAGAALDVVTAPVELLREIQIVDTPGTNAIEREHEAITRDFVPRSDLVLFVTSADRPFTESERAFLEGIRDWGKKIVVVINKIDILETPAEVAAVRAFVGRNAAALLGAEPPIFAVSARRALRAKTSGDEAALAASHFGELERFVVSTLDERERVRLKLDNPLGVATHLAQRYLEAADGRLDLLKADFAALADIERQLALYREDLGREFRLRLADVGAVLQEFEGRGMQFFDDTLRLGRVFDLVQKTRIKAEFEAKVVADVPQVIERRVHEVIDWLIAADLRQWQAVMAHLARRREEHADRIVGQVGGPFDLDRNRLLESVGRAAQQTIDGYDQEAESSRLAASVQAAVASTALVEVGAVGLGALVAHLLVGAAADATGVLAAGLVAVLGLFIIPSRRQAAKRDLAARIAALRAELMAALTAQFEREVERSLHRIDDAVAPYTRFVRAERDRLGAVRDELQGVAGELAALRRRVAAL